MTDKRAKRGGRRVNGYYDRQRKRTAENKRKRVARNEAIRKRKVENKARSHGWSGQIR